MNKNFWLFLLLCAITISSCTVNKDIMFKTPVDYSFDEIPRVDSIEYQITPYDRIRFSLFTNDGYKLVDILGQGQGGNNAQSIRQFGLTYLIEQDGKVKLPTLGRVDLAGLTIIEAEEKLESFYSEYYRKPFIQLSVVNNRVIVSPGAGGAAQVVNIEGNMTVIEVLSMAGGLASRGNASRVKIIRDVGDQREVYKLDLSRIEGIEDGDLIVQANDIIYVEPNPEIAREILRDITPVISLITSSLALYAILTR
jgi:polysaccharide export outer membrane protein